jgi:translation initiation factor 2 beta subunit (eIF-2beta)/eIF-5
MKVSEVIQEFVPCEICGNNDLNNFYFYVLATKGSQAYVKCCECEEEYYSISARNILVRSEELRKARIGSRITLKNRNQESVHPLVKVLARI